MGAEGEADRRIDRRDLFDDGREVERGKTGAAILFGDHRAHEAEISEPGNDLPVKALGLIMMHHDRPDGGAGKFVCGVAEKINAPILHHYLRSSSTGLPPVPRGGPLLEECAQGLRAVLRSHE